MNETISVPPESAGERLDKFLFQHNPAHTRGAYQKLISKEMVTVNGKACKASLILTAGDLIDVSYGAHLLHPLPTSSETIPVLYEDEFILVVNKPPGLIVHPTTGEEEASLIQNLLSKYPNLLDAVYDMDSEISRMRPGIVHRLDKDTSGVMIVAKTQASLLAMSKQFHEHTVQKEYTALVYGQFDSSRTIHTRMRRKPMRRNQMGVVGLDKEGREAITHLEPLQVFSLKNKVEHISLVQARIETGRTHQIRVHCKFIGHAVLGDKVYTNKHAQLASQRLGISRQMLHASRLDFDHPISGERICFTCELPEDMQAIIQAIS